MTSSWGQAYIARRIADDRRRDDAHQQRRTIVVDQDADWLIATLKEMGNRDMTVRLTRAMRFSFFPEDGEAVYDHAVKQGDLIVVEMAEASIVSLLEGFDFSTWVFRIDNGIDGPNGERIDVAFRALDTGDYLLYLRERRVGRRVVGF